MTELLITKLTKPLEDNQEVWSRFETMFQNYEESAKQGKPVVYKGWTKWTKQPRVWFKEAVDLPKYTDAKSKNYKVEWKLITK